MRIFLAATALGFSQKRYDEIIDKYKPLYLLESFADGAKTCDRVLNHVDTDNFILDSGAFTIMNAKRINISMEEWTEQYIDYINSRNIKYFMEMDIDSVIGYDKVLQLRKRIEKSTNRPCIPVWHTSRGVKEYKRMLDEYDYVALGGLTKNVISPNDVKRLVYYARCKNKKVHGLGFTKPTLLNQIPFYSVDSCSYSKTAYMSASKMTFTGNGFVVERVADRKTRLNARNIVVYNFANWCKYQRYMDGRW